MKEMSENKKLLLDNFGRLIVSFRDRTLRMSIAYANGTTQNSKKVMQYEKLSKLSLEIQENITELLSETITDTIYSFLEMFEDNPENAQLFLIEGEEKFDVLDISEKISAEIVRADGWIQRFSKEGKFVL